MTTPSNQDMILGEMRGQLREVVHTVNNMSMKFDNLSKEVGGLAALATDVAELRIKVAALIADQNQREGARNMGSAIMKSPALGWFVGAVVTVWAVVTGKIG